MNLILLKYGFGPACISREIKDDYNDAIQQAQLTGIKKDWQNAVVRNVITPGSDNLHRIVLEAGNQSMDYLLMCNNQMCCHF